MRRFLVFSLGLVVAATALTIPLSGTRKTFVPDWTFKGSALTGFQTIGAAQWTATNGEIVGRPTSPEGGWLVLDKSLQDVEFGADFRCAEGCKTGVLLRAQKTPAGMKGVFVALDGTAPVGSALVIDAAGKEVSRQPIAGGGGMARFATGTSPSAPAPRAGGAPAADAGRGAPAAGADAAGRGGRRGGGAGAPGAAPGAPGVAPGAPAGGAPAAPAGGRAAAPPAGGRGVSAVASIVPRPSNAIKPNDWNDLDIIIDVTLLRPHVNSSNAGGGGAVTDDMGAYGPIALYVGGTGEVRFRDVSYKDLHVKSRVAERVSPNFTMHRLTPFQYTWAQGVGDVDRDGNQDIFIPPFVFMGPNFLKAREFYAAETLNPSTTYPSIMVGFAGDFTGDGYADYLSTNGGRLYVNPKGETRRWDMFPAVVTGVSEICVMKDIDADGKPDLVHVNSGTLAYSSPDPANPTGKWITTVISEPQSTGGHGIGAGDINGDGKMDILNAYGWWEQPAAGPKSGLWKYHPQAFGRWTGRAGEGGAEMSVYDVNGDRLNDVVTALSAHGFGVAWFEQKKDAAGNITFVQHMIMDDFASQNAGNMTPFSEPHGSTSADVDGDGVQDFIVGKRLFAHHEGFLDPDGYGPAVLYAFLTRRDAAAPGRARFVPELIHNQSGAGSQVLAADVNKDGITDVVTSGVMGGYVFIGRPRGARAAAPAPAAAPAKKQ